MVAYLSNRIERGRNMRRSRVPGPAPRIVFAELGIGGTTLTLTYDVLVELFPNPDLSIFLLRDGSFLRLGGQGTVLPGNIIHLIMSDPIGDTSLTNVDYTPPPDAIRSTFFLVPALPQLAFPLD